MPGATPGWRAAPGTVVLPPGGEASIRFVLTDDDGGTTTGLPAGAAVEASSDGVTFEITEDGEVAVHAGAGIDTVLLAVTIPGEDLAVPVWITIANLDPDATEVVDGAVVFPVPGAAPDAATWTLGLPDVDDDGVGPFTWAELAALQVLPDEEALLADGAVPDIRFPVVLHGIAAPAVGDVLVATGDAAFRGRVLSVTSRSGFHLVQLQFVGLPAAFHDLRSDIGSEEMIDLGVIPATYELTTGGVPEPGGAGNRRTYDASRLARPVQAPDGGGNGSGQGTGVDPACAAQLGLTPGAEEGLPVQIVLHPIVHAGVSILGGSIATGPEASNLLVTAFRADVDGRLDFGVGPAWHPFTCTLAEWSQIDLPLPAWLDDVAHLGLRPRVDVTTTGEGSTGAATVDVPVRCTALDAPFAALAGAFGPVPDDVFSALATAAFGPPRVEPKCSTIATSAGEAAESAADAAADLGVTIEASGDFVAGLAPRFRAILFGPADAGTPNPTLTVSTGTIDAVGQVTFETAGHVLEEGSAIGRLAYESAGDLQPFAGPVDALLRLAAGTPTSRIRSALERFGFPQRIASAWETDAYTVTIGSHEPLESPAEITVVPGQRIELDVTVSPSIDPAENTPTFIESARAFTRFFGEDQQWQAIGGATATGGDHGVHLKVVMTESEATCRAHGDDGVTLGVVGLSTSFDPSQGPAGTIAAEGASVIVRCEIPALGFVPERLDIGPEAVDVEHRVQILLDDLTTHREDWTWHLETMPPWVQRSANAGNWVVRHPLDGGGFTLEEVDQTVGLTVDCDVAGDGKVEGSVTFSANSPDSTFEAHATLPVTADCRDQIFEVETLHFEASGTQRLRIQGGDDAHHWFVFEAPDWVTITPAEGVLNEALTVQSMAITIPVREATCDVQPERTGIVRLTTNQADFHAADQVFRVTQPEVPALGSGGPRHARSAAGAATATDAVPEVCHRPTPVRVWGDPHLATFDGPGFDAQVLGEYTYLRPTGGTGAELHLRHDLTRPGANGLNEPTSVVGAAFRAEGHTLEVLSRPAVAVLLDGLPLVLDEGVPLEPVVGFTITRSGGDISVRADGVDVVVTQRGSGGTGYLDVTITAVGPYQGILGTPDGVAGNDLVGADGTTYAYGDVAQHGDALYAFTDSWRVHDLADSLFSSPDYGQFDAANPTRDDAAFAQYRQQVIDALGQIGRICDGSATAASPIVNALALELAIGGDLGDFTGYSCSYAVSGTAAADDEPVAGVEVTVDAPGLLPCTTVTAGSGGFVCTAGVDLDELAAMADDEPAFPMSAAVTGRWAGTTTVITSATATFPTRAPLGSGTHADGVRLAIDPSLLPTLDLSGRATDLGAPRSGAFPLRFEALDASGNVLATLRSTVVAGVDGAFAATRHLPRGTTSARLVAEVGLTETDFLRTTVTGLGNGSNARTWDFDTAAPVVHLHGRATLDGARFGDTVTYEVLGFDDQGRATTGSGFVQAPLDAEGDYAVDVTMSRSTTTVRVTLATGTRVEWFQLDDVPVANGVNDVLLDAPYVSRSVHVVGSIGGSGDFRDPVLVRVLTWTGDNAGTGDFLGSTAEQGIDAGDGGYDLTFALPRTAGSAIIQVEITDDPQDVVNRNIVLHDGTNDVVFDVEHSPVPITIEGTITSFGRPYTGGAIAVIAYADATGQTIFRGSVVSLEPDEDGHYEAHVLAPDAARSASARVELDGYVYQSAGITFEPGDDAVLPFDFDHQPRRLYLDGNLQLAGEPAGDRVAAHVDHLDATGVIIGGEDLTIRTDDDFGDYQFDVLVPRQAVRSVVEYQTGEPFDWSHQTFDLEAETDTEVRADDIDYTPTTVVVDGRSRTLGVVADEVFVELRVLDEFGDDMVPQRTQTVHPTDPEGDWGPLDFGAIPHDARTVRVGIRNTFPGIGPGGGPLVQGLAIGENVQPQAENHYRSVVDQQALRLTGDLVQDGAPRTYIDGLVIEATELDADDASVGGFGRNVQRADLDAAGHLDVQLYPNGSATHLQLHIGPGLVVDVPLDADGDTTFDLGTYEYVMQHTVAATGHVFIGLGAEPPDSVAYTVSAFTLAADGTLTPLATPEHVVGGVLDDGYFGRLFTVPIGADVVDVAVDVGDGGLPYHLGARFDPNAIGASVDLPIGVVYDDQVALAVTTSTCAAGPVAFGLDLVYADGADLPVHAWTGLAIPGLEPGHPGEYRSRIPVPGFEPTFTATYDTTGLRPGGAARQVAHQMTDQVAGVITDPLQVC